MGLTIAPAATRRKEGYGPLHGKEALDAAADALGDGRLRAQEPDPVIEGGQDDVARGVHPAP